LSNTRTTAQSVTNSFCVGPFYPEVKRPEHVAHPYSHLVPALIVCVSVTKLSYTHYCTWINLTVPFMQEFAKFR